ncbi:hypothetical protein [Sinobaca sp. H24]|nr:hypothetical protein [Sinobaca sp. H24]
MARAHGLENAMAGELLEFSTVSDGMAQNLEEKYRYYYFRTLLRHS